jgi:hypothetical protein
VYARHVSCDVKYISTSVPNDYWTDKRSEIEVERIRVLSPHPLIWHLLGKTTRLRLTLVACNLLNSCCDEITKEKGKSQGQMTIQEVTRRGSYGRDRDGRKKDERKLAKKEFPQHRISLIAAAAASVGGFNSGNPIAGVR